MHISFDVVILHLEEKLRNFSVICLHFVCESYLNVQCYFIYYNKNGNNLNVQH